MEVSTIYIFLFVFCFLFKKKELSQVLLLTFYFSLFWKLRQTHSYPCTLKSSYNTLLSISNDFTHSLSICIFWTKWFMCWGRQEYLKEKIKYSEKDLPLDYQLLHLLLKSFVSHYGNLAAHIDIGIMMMHHLPHFFLLNI